MRAAHADAAKVDPLDFAFHFGCRHIKYADLTRNLVETQSREVCKCRSEEIEPEFVLLQSSDEICESVTLHLPTD